MGAPFPFGAARLVNYAGLSSLVILGERETWERITLQAEPAGAACPKCGQSDELSDPVSHTSVIVADTPARGKPCEIELSRFRYRCRRCACGFVGRAADIHPRKHMTWRLVRYIENSAPRRPRQAIADETGIAHDRVDRIAYALADRLAEQHRFPTPPIIGIDDIKMNKKAYTLITDAETGHGVGFIEGATTDKIESFIKAKLQPDEIKVVVSDLAKAHIELCKRPGLDHVIHVADQWHVLKACRKSMSPIIARTLAKLDRAAKFMKAKGFAKKQNLPRRLAKQLRTKRRQLLGRRDYVRTDDRTIIDDQELADVLDRFKLISRAFYARIALNRTFAADDPVEARNQLDRFYRQSAGAPIKKAMAPAVSTVRSHEHLILNAALARAAFPHAARSAFSTSSTERRNGTVRGAWKAGRGVNNFNYLRLLALYQPWQLDVDIVECAQEGCSNIEGPVPLVSRLVGQQPDQPVLPRHAFRCRSHRSAAFASVQTPNVR